nr:MAG TPA: hypothetical protein [Caudoviricetes sp.]
MLSIQESIFNRRLSHVTTIRSVFPKICQQTRR